MAESHIRIDEGIKRGPRKPLQARRRSPKGDLGGWVIPEDLKPQEVLQRYLVAETTSQIAQEYGLSRKALTKWLREKCPVEWKQVQILRALDQKDKGNEGLIDPPHALSLACAREQLKSAQWELTALDPDYQPKQQITVTNIIKMDSLLNDEFDLLLVKVRGVASTPNAALPQSIIDVTPKD